MDRAEATGFGVSVVGHGALLLAAWLIVNRPVPTEVSQAFEVSYVDEVGLTSASPSPSSTPAAAPTAPEAGPVEDARSEPEPPPLPSPAPSPSAEARPAPPRPTPRTTPRTNPGTGERTTREDVSNWDPNRFGRDPNSRSNNPPAPVFGSEARASLNAALLRALAPCERQPLPAPEAAAIRVRIAVALDPSGNLVSARVLGTSNADGDLARYADRMRDIALAVVRRCTPIRGLPAEFYSVPGGWRTFNYTFPRRS